jgi:uncharacterized membrane protein YqgA involved in biofilm formation
LFGLFGTFVNTLAIVAGSLVGLVLRGGLPEAYRLTVIQAIGLAVVLIGLRGALGCDDLLLVIFSLAIGAALGTALKIEARLESLGQRIERRFGGNDNDLARGFVTASLVFCVGSMAIVGSLESGLADNHQTLFAKSVLDGISSIVFASSFGVGVLFSALPVLVYQGAITLSASLLKPLLVPAVVAQMSAVGGLLIVAIGFNLLDIANLRVGNMLPAIFLPLVYFFFRQLAGLG